MPDAEHNSPTNMLKRSSEFSSRAKLVAHAAASAEMSSGVASDPFGSRGAVTSPSAPTTHSSPLVHNPDEPEKVTRLRCALVLAMHPDCGLPDVLVKKICMML